MEAWTLINKNTNKIVRCEVIYCDIVHGEHYGFVDCIYSPIWFVKTREEVELVFRKEEYLSNFGEYERPIVDKINLEDYIIAKFETK